MKISKAEMRLLVKEFKDLVEEDVNGITCSDARNTVYRWLGAVGQDQAAQDFQNGVWKYQNSPKIRKLEEQVGR